MRNKDNYKRPRIGELKRTIRELTEERDGLISDKTALKGKTREQADTIAKQAAHIRALEVDKLVLEETIRLRQEELDKLYTRNWLERLLNTNLR